MYWGSKSWVVHSEESTLPMDCRVCKKSDKQTLHACQNTFTILGLSFFPTSREVLLTCNHCGKIKRVKQRNWGTIDAIDGEGMFANGGGKWKYYSGPIVIAVIAVLIVIAFKDIIF